MTMQRGRPQKIARPKKIRERLNAILTDFDLKIQYATSQSIQRTIPGDKKFSAVTFKNFLEVAKAEAGLIHSKIRPDFANMFRPDKSNSRSGLDPGEIDIICEIFDGVTSDMLTVVEFADFTCIVEKIKKGEQNWITANKFYETKRKILAPFIKPFYKSPSDPRDVDDMPDFPLITKKGWLLDPPFELTLISEKKLISGDPADFNWSERVARPLQGTKVRYADLKRRSMGVPTEFYNAKAYRLTGVETRSAGPHRLSFNGSWYFDFINELEVLGAELAAFYIDHSEEGTIRPSVDGSDLPLRGTPERVLELDRRPCVAGFNTLLIMLRKNEDHVFYMHYRGKIGEAPNIFHVAPSGTFQPEGKRDPDSGETEKFPYSLWQTAYRELGEEFLDITTPEFDALSSVGQAGQLFATDGMTLATIRLMLSKNQNPDIDQCKKLFKTINKIIDDTEKRKQQLSKILQLTTNGKAKLFYLGCGLDPVSTKAELLGCMVIDTREIPDWLVKPNFEGQLHKKSLNRPEIEKWSKSADVLPAGQACLRQALSHLNKMTNPFGVTVP